MSALAWWLNTAWMCKCAAEGAAFRRATKDVWHVQRAVLGHILHANRHTAFGVAHCFGEIAGVRSFRRRVPVVDYDDLAPWIGRAAAGEPNVLTAEAVERFAPTSGTARGEKLIPYTASLRRQFQRGVAAWVGDLYARRPAVRAGRAYWSISPAMGPPRRTPGGIPIGFADDAEYLGRAERWALRHLLAVPAAVARLPGVEAARYATLLFLLAADDLSLVSVWSPSFLTALLEPLDAWRDRLLHDLRRGTFSPPVPVPDETARALRPWLAPRPRRAGRLRALFRDTAARPEQLRRVWPRLALISCWADASARHFLGGVRRLFPGVEIQPKGLLATEGIVSLPVVGREGAALAVRSHFYEFEEAGSSGRLRLAHELERGGRYRVALTTGGGLYRYRLGDEVEVVGSLRRCPLLRFAGRGDRTSDLVGEKLSEAHVQAVLDRLLTTAPSFALLVPVLTHPPRYRLYLQGGDQASLAEALQAGLEENPYYRHATAAGQLAPAEVRVLDPAAGSAWAVYEGRWLEMGRKSGDLKPAVLDPWAGWEERFERAFPDGGSRGG